MEPLTPRRMKKNAGFVGLKDDEDGHDGEDVILEEILASDEEESYYEEEVIEDEVQTNLDPFVVNTRTQSALTVPTSNMAHEQKAAPSSLLRKEPGDLAAYAELAVAKMVADQQKSKGTQNPSTKARGSRSPTTKNGESGNSSVGEPPRIYPIDEPPRISPVPIFEDTTTEPGTKPLEPRSSDDYYSDPPATLIIRSFKARSTPFVAHDELSDISPILQSYDEMTASGQEVQRANEEEPEPSSASETEQGSDSALIQANHRSDDPEVGCQQVPTTSIKKTVDPKPRVVHQILALLLFVFVCSATGYLVVYIFDFVQSGGKQKSVTALGGKNHTSTTPPNMNFVGAKPTTSMDAYEAGCSLRNYSQPHVIGQCACNGDIAILTDEVREKYYALKALFIEMNTSGDWDLPVESCEPRNQALVWLATTYAKDREDLVQKYVLAAFFIQMSGQQWANQQGWLVEGDICSWSGVSCNDNGFVASIFLDRNGLKGSIPYELSLLQSLEALSLRSNAITGEIPYTLFSMPYINELSLSSNNLMGTLPPEVSLASNLEILRLDMNSLDGSLDPFLGQLSLLKKLNIAYNQFIGTLPLELFQLIYLEELVLEGNPRITGRLPPDLGNLQHLEHFDISNTNILARIPTQLAYLTNMRVLKVADSQMSGIIPTQIVRLTNLNHLDLSGSKFRRGIPTLLGQLPFLTYLALNNNQLTGTIPPTLGNITELVHLSLHGNQLFGEIPKHLGYLTMLDTLTLEDNFLTGRAPREVCSLRREELIVFTTDCSDGSEGVLCPVPNCCTSCVS